MSYAPLDQLVGFRTLRTIKKWEFKSFFCGLYLLIFTVPEIKVEIFNILIYLFILS